MNSFVTNAILRYGVNWIGGIVTSHGLMTGSMWEQVAGIAVAAITAGIGAASSTQAAQVKAVQSHGLAVVPAQPESPAMMHAGGNNS